MQQRHTGNMLLRISDYGDWLACSIPSWDVSVTKRSFAVTRELRRTFSQHCRVRSTADKCAAHSPHPGLCANPVGATLQLVLPPNSRSPTRRCTHAARGYMLYYGSPAPGQRRRPAGCAWLVEPVHRACHPGLGSAPPCNHHLAPRSSTTLSDVLCTCEEQGARA